MNALQVVAAPNISRDGQPIQFRVLVGEVTPIQISIYNLIGEKIYSTGIQAQVGMNTFSWPMVNNQNQGVASGLYVYVIREGSGSSPRTTTGKVVVIH
jgi:hypothetical protein